MQRYTHSIRSKCHRVIGFSLMETLVAMAVFTVGFVAVASIFPAGAMMQRHAADDVLSRHFARNAEAIISALKLTWKYDSAGPAVTGDLANPLYHTTTASFEYNIKVFTPAVLNRWSLDNRSYPSNIANADERNFYWVPLVYDLSGDPTNAVWQIPMFILRRESGKTYPDAAYPTTLPAGVPGLRSFLATRTDFDEFDITPSGGDFYLNVGDSFLASSTEAVLTPGTGSVPAIYRVKEYDASTNRLTVFGFIDSSFGTGVIWYAPPAFNDTDSPTMKIILTTPNITEP